MTPSQMILLFTITILLGFLVAFAIEYGKWVGSHPESFVVEVSSNVAILLKRGDYEKGDEILRRALDEVQKMLNAPADPLAILYLTLFDSYRTARDSRFHLAEHLCKDAVQFNESVNHELGKALSYDLVGILYLARNDYDESRSWLTKAVTINRKLNRLDMAALDYVYLGAIDFSQAKKVQARSNWIQAREIYQKLGLSDAADSMLEKIKSTDSLDEPVTPKLEQEPEAKVETVKSTFEPLNVEDRQQLVSKIASLPLATNQEIGDKFTRTKKSWEQGDDPKIIQQEQLESYLQKLFTGICSFIDRKTTYFTRYPDGRLGWTVDPNKPYIGYSWSYKLLLEEKHLRIDLHLKEPLLANPDNKSWVPFVFMRKDNDVFVFWFHNSIGYQEL